MLVCVFVMTLDATFMAKKRNLPLQCHHAVEFGMWICECSAGAIPVAVTEICQLCEVFIK